MNYIVMDLEFNQPFDFAKNKKKKANPLIQFEIIQIGCVKLNEKFEKIDELNIIIKPVVYKKIHPFVHKITGISQRQINDGESFEIAYSKLVNLIDQDTVFCVWGDVDLKLLYKNVSYHKLDEANLTNKYINVQKIASKEFSIGGGNLIGLRNAIEQLDIQINCPFHDAFNDAVYTSLVFEKLEFDSNNIKIFTEDKNRKQDESQTGRTPQDFKALYSYCEKEMGRKLTQKEKKLYRNIYLIGLNKQK